LIDVEGAIVTIDAAGCQKNIAAQIVCGSKLADGFSARPEHGC
jgi:predicted transposase YbfD/YdcC